MRSPLFLAVWLGFLLAVGGCGTSPSEPAAFDGAAGDATANDAAAGDAAAGDAAAGDAATQDDGAGDTTVGAAGGPGSWADGGATPRTTIRVMSFNVLCSFCVFPDYDPWTERVPHLQRVIADHNVDLLGLQELTFAWDDKDEVADMIAGLQGFAALYYQSPKGEGALPAYPDATIYYRKSRFELVKNGYFWLSPTPDTAFSSGFAAKGSLPRIVAWAALKDLHRGGREVLFLSTHFDNNSPSQEKSAPLLVERIALLRVSSAGAPNALRELVGVGDFNATPSSAAYKSLTAKHGAAAPLIDSQTLATTIERIGAPADQAAWQVADGIDHIFVTASATGALPTVLRWAVDLRRFGAKDRFPSDHWPVLAEVQLP